MNRYLREVVEFDRRHRMRVRVISLAAAACVIAAALWSAGIPNAGWFAWLRSEETKAPAPQAQPVVTLPAVPGPSTTTPSVQRLHLVSTSPGRNAREGTAQLGTDRASPQTYAAGALLENGATLTEIYADHVLIERDGQTTELYVDGMATRPRTTKPVVESLVAVTAPAADAVPPGASPPTYTDVIRAAPRFENDVIVGFDVYPGARSGDFARFGLHAGDLLVTIDGAPVTSTEALNAALKQLAGGASMVAIVTRDGQEVSIALDGSPAAQSQTALARAGPPLQ